MGPHGTPWNHLEPLGTPWDHLGPLGGTTRNFEEPSDVCLVLGENQVIGGQFRLWGKTGHWGEFSTWGKVYFRICLLEDLSIGSNVYSSNWAASLTDHR